MVEVREGGLGAYGQGRKVSMAFGEFVKRVAAGDTAHYLSAQQVAVAPDGHAELAAPPVAQLLPLLPLRPPQVPHLVPQSINMWMGAAPEGSSTGLHNDFHDNLYVLLRPPALAPNTPPPLDHAPPPRLLDRPAPRFPRQPVRSSTGLHHDFHDNLYVLLRGRKRFRLFPPSALPCMYVRGAVARTHANGRVVYKGQGDVAADGSDAGEASRWLARRAAEAAVAAAEAAAARGGRGAAAALRAAEARLEAILDGELDGGGSDDYDDDCLGATGSNDHGGGVKHDGPPPPSFSRVDMTLPPAELRRRFPRFPGARGAVVAEVAAGQCLYLPAGWFHEVTSYSEPGCATHLALNWWFHPPDNLAPTRAAFAAPYTSEYWPAVWEGRRARLEAAAARGGGGGEADGGKRRLQQQGGSGEGAAAKRPKGGPAAAGRGGSGGGGARVRWTQAQPEPGNRYYRGNTHPGTASGTAAVWPPPRAKGEPPGGGGGKEAGAAGAEAEPPEDAVAAFFKNNPDGVRQLFAQFMAARGGGGGGEEGGGGGGGRRRPSPLAAGRRHHMAVAYRERKRVKKPHPDMS
ncbi:MAG: cupin-like domain-containing protein [Monoraphidium minutum]|nr:MAG: cupin-like domain-containing protein [Monoraphidium minutum]